MGIRAANRAYERWLKAELDGDIVARDLARKHEKMAAGPFEFLRATYWRWAEEILKVCPELADAMPVLAVGDIHLENFGTWRDVEGRLVWGVNDYDEAAVMPYTLDLVRLGASAVLAQKKRRLTIARVCAAILAGYGDGLADPGPFVLDRRHRWLRDDFFVSPAQGAAFWNKLRQERRKAANRHKRPALRYRNAVAASLPEKGIELSYWPRTAGTGSLGRPRWLGYADWRGGPLLREAKALVPSGWTRVADRGAETLRVGDIAGGRHRSPDPCYEQRGRVVVRRLSPNNRKLEVDDAIEAVDLFKPDMLQAMGRELAAIHLGRGDYADAIRSDLAQRRRRWLRTSVESAAEFVRSEQHDWKQHMT